MDNAETNSATRRIQCGVPTGDVISTTSRTSSAADPAVERARQLWGAGDYNRIGHGIRDEAAAFVARLGITPGQCVLDAACGTGNLTIPAARMGAQVVGLDIVPELLETAAAWGQAEGLAIAFDEGTVEDMPYADAQFDVVMSMFGLIFAPRPDRVVSELARVTRRGGKVALASWTRQGFVGRMLALHVRHAPPPAGSQSPLLWGDEDVVRQRFDPREWDVTTTERPLTFHYPHTPAGTAELFRGAYGPTVRTFGAITEDQRAELSADLANHWTTAQKPGATGTEVDAEYLEVMAVRR